MGFWGGAAHTCADFGSDWQSETMDEFRFAATFALTTNGWSLRGAVATSEIVSEVTATTIKWARALRTTERPLRPGRPSVEPVWTLVRSSPTARLVGYLRLPFCVTPLAILATHSSSSAVPMGRQLCLT